MTTVRLLVSLVRLWSGLSPCHTCLSKTSQRGSAVDKNCKNFQPPGTAQHTPPCAINPPAAVGTQHWLDSHLMPLHTVSKCEDEKHTVQLPWEYFWRFVWKFFGWVNQLVQQMSGCLVSGERAEEEAECAVQGLVWFHDVARPVGCPVRCTSLVEVFLCQASIQWTYCIIRNKNILHPKLRFPGQEFSESNHRIHDLSNKVVTSFLPGCRDSVWS